MVLVDSSIWISLFRRQHTSLGRTIIELVASNQAAICGQVWVEYLGGFRNHAVRRQHRNLLKEYPWLETPRSAYELAAELLAQYPRLGAGDSIVAATAIVADVELLTLDKDFSPLKAKGLALRAIG